MTHVLLRVGKVLAKGTHSYFSTFTLPTVSCGWYRLGTSLSIWHTKAIIVPLSQGHQEVTLCDIQPFLKLFQIFNCFTKYHEQNVSEYFCYVVNDFSASGVYTAAPALSFPSYNHTVLKRPIIIGLDGKLSYPLLNPSCRLAWASPLRNNIVCYRLG